MHPLKCLLLGALALLVLVVISQDVEAGTTAYKGSCSVVDIVSATGDRAFELYDNFANCQTGTAAPTDIVSGSAISLTCAQVPSGAVPPQVPDVGGVTIRAYADDTGFPNGAGQFFSTTTNACNAVGTQSIFCTSDGTAGGTPRYGLVRLYIRAVRTVVGTTYDDNSDQGSQGSDTAGYGAFRCDPNITAVNATAASAVHTFVGGDTLSLSLTANAATYGSPAAVLSPQVTCGSSFGLTAFNPTTSATAETIVIQGSASSWIDDCTLTYKWTMQTNAALTGFTSVKWFAFAAGGSTIPAGTTSNALTLTWTPGQVVDRTLSPSSCTMKDGNNTAHVTVTLINRLQEGELVCTWADARATNLGNNAIMRGWLQNAGDYRSTHDFPSADLLTTTGGVLTTDNVATEAATVTTGGALDYHGMGEQFGTTSRTDVVLYNWGNTSAVFDVSSTLTVTCHLLDPVDLVTSDITSYNPGETLLCRQVRLQWADGVDVDSGIIKIAWRRSTQAAFSTSDANTCNTTTNTTAATGWVLCSPAVALSAQATYTTGLAYVVDVGQYATTLRTPLANSGTTSGKFDVVATTTVSCTLRSPVTFATLPDVGLYNPGEVLPCRDGSYTNARGEGVPSAFLRVNYRRASQPSGDTTDAPACDVTTNTTGTWKCDSQARPVNSADTVRATLTSTQAYIVQARTFQDSGRSVFLTSANTSNDFDITANYTVDCGLRDPVSLADPVLFVQRGNAADCPTFAANATNARGEGEPSGAFFTVYYRRASQPDRDTTDFPQCNKTSTTAGVWGACDSTATSTAVATTGQTYVVEVSKWIDSGHTRLMVEANTTGLFDVSGTWSFDGINISKTSLGSNASSFTIGTDVEFTRAKGLHDANGNALSGKSVTCTRMRPDMTSETGTVMGATDASGNSPEQQFQVFAPQGLWTMDCTTSGGGNSASYHIAFFHVSAFTANSDMTLNWNVTVNQSGGYDVNLTVLIRTFDASVDGPVKSFADDVVKFTVFNKTSSDQNDYLSTIIFRAVGTQVNTLDSGYWTRFHANESDLKPAFGYVTANITGRPFENGASFYLPQASGLNGNFTGSFMGDVTFTSLNGMLSTVWDSYLPLLLWGGLLVLFLWFNAWLPAIVVLMDFMNDILPAGRVWPLAGSFMLLLLAVTLHSLGVNGFVPIPFNSRIRDDNRDEKK